jgi:hypothetical protein
MRASDIVIGEKYILKDNNVYPYVKVLEVLPKKEGVNTNNFIVVKCHHLMYKNDDSGRIKYFRPRDSIQQENPNE